MRNRWWVAGSAAALVIGLGLPGYPHHPSPRTVAPEVCEHQGPVVDVYKDDDAPVLHVVCRSGVIMEVRP